MNEQRTELERFKRDSRYAEAHREELLAEYPEQWVAIFNQQVVGAAASFEDLLTELEQRGVPIENALIEHVTRKEDVLILPYECRTNRLRARKSRGTPAGTALGD